MTRKAKIVGTLGPASQEESVLRRMILAGLDVARLNFSHGTHAGHSAFIVLLRKLSAELGRPVTILQDLSGPKLRVGALPEGGLELVAGQTVLLTDVEENRGGASAEDRLIIPMEVPDLTRSVEPGNHILMDDGHLELAVTAVLQGAVEARVLLGGRLTSHKGVNLPGAKLAIPGFTAKDREDLAFGLKEGVDAVALSFVRRAGDVELLRQVIAELAPNQPGIPIIAKLELPEAIDNLEEITLAADGVMVARGDLAVETSPASVPIVQKRIIDAANRHNKLVITATQMLESMIHNPRPTRAEASDVANAILDGSDAVMLSAETAVGKYPVESVAMMDSVVREAEKHFAQWGRVFAPPTASEAAATIRAAREMAEESQVAHIAVFTKTGRTAILMSKARPRAPILAFTPEWRTYQRLGLCWGVIPYLAPFSSDVEEMLEHLGASIAGATGLPPGQRVVVVSSFPVNVALPPNLALLYTLPPRLGC